MTAAAKPADVAATANSVAVVVLATPPFWDAMTSVFMNLRIRVDRPTCRQVGTYTACRTASEPGKHNRSESR